MSMRSKWLILLVVVSVCVVFCVLCSNRRPDDCTFICYSLIFFQFCNNWCFYFDTTVGYLRFISTIGQMTVPFFSGRNFSGCNLNPPKNIAGQTTAPFFPVVIFSSCIYDNWCSCQNTNTNYNPKKLRPKRKVQSTGRLCFSNHP